MKYCLGIGQAAVGQAVLSADKALAGEEGHLRVVGDPSATAVGRGIAADSTRPESPLDLAPGVELHRRAEGITDRATEEAANYALLACRLGHGFGR